jgi:hypothetical protein
MLKVGINDNLTLSKVEIVEKEGKASIDFSFGDSASVGPDELNPFSVNVDANGMTPTGSSFNTIKWWAPSPADAKKTDGSLRTQVEIAQDTMKTVLELKNLLQQFALCFTTSDKINLNDYIRGTACTKENWLSVFPTEQVLLQVTRNLIKDFNAAVGEYLGKKDPQYQLRVICVRQSTAKHYASFRKNFIADNPVVENAIVPITATKLKFTAYELKNGLDKDTPVQAVPDNLPDSDLTPENVFGNG